MLISWLTDKFNVPEKTLSLHSADYPKVWPFPTKSLATSVQPIFHQILTVFLDAHPGSC